MRETFNIVPDTYMYNALLGFCTAVHDVAQASYFIEEMKDLHVERDANTYNCFMSCLVDAAPYEETLKTFREMTETHIRPTVRTYNTVLKAACTNNDYDRGFQVFEEMKKMGQVPDVVSYNLLLCLCQQRLDYVMARNKYAKLNRTQEQKAQGKVSLVELIMVLLFEMEKMGIRPNTFSYNKILSVLYECNDYKLFGIFDKMLAEADSAKNKELFAKKVAKPSATSSPFGLPSVIRHEEESEFGSPQSIRDDGIDLVFNNTNPQDVCSISGVGVLINKESFLLMLRAYLEMGYVERCKPLAETDMKARGIVLDRDLALVLWDICAAVKDEVWADMVLVECKQRNVRVDTPLYNKYLGVLAAVGSPRLFRIFSEMQVGIHTSAGKPDSSTYNVVVRGHMVQEQEEEAFTLLQSMLQPYSPVKPDEDSYCLLIELCERKKDAELPTSTLKQMLSRPPQRKAEDDAGAHKEDDNARGGAHAASEAEQEEERLPVKVCHRLLRLYVTLKDERITEWFQQMKAAAKRDGRIDARGPPPPPPAAGAERYPAADAETYSIMMRYHLACRQNDLVKRLFEELKTSHTLGLNSESYEVMLDMYHEQNDLKAVKNLFDDARICNVRFNILMYNKLLDTGLHGNDELYIVAILQDMKANGIPPADSSLAILLASELGRHVLSVTMKNDLSNKTRVQ